MTFDYNDYELIYLYRDGNQKALDVLCKKYGYLIAKVCKRYFFGYNEKLEDLIQEGYLILYRCLRFYNQDSNATFYTYFMLALTRGLSKQMKDEYYCSVYVSDSYLLNVLPDNNSLYSIEKYASIFDDEITRRIYLDCYVANMPLKTFSKRMNISYNIIYRKSKYIEDELKKILTISDN